MAHDVNSTKKITTDYAKQVLLTLEIVSMNTDVKDVDNAAVFLTVVNNLVPSMCEQAQAGENPVEYLTYWAQTLYDWIERSPVDDQIKISKCIIESISIKKIAEMLPIACKEECWAAGEPLLEIINRFFYFEHEEIIESLQSINYINLL